MLSNWSRKLLHKQDFFENLLISVSMTLWCCEMLDISESYTIFLIVTYVVRATFQMRFLIPD